MIHCNAAASILAGILLLFVSSQTYVTAIDTNDDDTDKEDQTAHYDGDPTQPGGAH